MKLMIAKYLSIDDLVSPQNDGSGGHRGAAKGSGRQWGIIANDSALLALYLWRVSLITKYFTLLTIRESENV